MREDDFGLWTLPLVVALVVFRELTFKPPLHEDERTRPSTEAKRPDSGIREISPIQSSMASRPAARGESVELVLEMDAARPPLLVQRERPIVLAPRADEQRRDGPAGRHPAGLEGRWHSVRIHLPKRAAVNG